MNILVVGKAKTGTTIISKTIEQSIKGKTKYHLEPQNITFFEQNFSLQPDVSHVVKIIFEHWNNKPRMRNAILYNESNLKFDKIVFIKRDFRDEIISRFMYILLPHSQKQLVSQHNIQKWIEILTIKENNPSQISFKKLISEMKKIFNIDFELHIKNCVATDLNYIKFIERNNKILHVIQYEDFIDDKIDDLQKHLGFNLIKERNVGKLSRTIRSKNYNNWKTFFTADDILYFQNIMYKNPQLRNIEDWQLTPIEKLNSQYFSQYLLRILKKGSPQETFYRRTLNCLEKKFHKKYSNFLLNRDTRKISSE